MQGSGKIYYIYPQTQAVYDIERVDALENLLEVCGMWCLQLPLEVQEALHQVPDIEKTHFTHKIGQREEGEK